MKKIEKFKTIETRIGVPDRGANTKNHLKMEEMPRMRWKNLPLNLRNIFTAKNSAKKM